VSDEKPHEILIIKRSRGHEEGGHGGAWKIAFADFMTAMMALFLVLWLISATNEKTKASLARYFNPVKLVEMTTLKPGLHDPEERSAADASSNAPPPAKPGPKKVPDTKDPKSTKASKPQAAATPAAYPPAHSEATLFRDPYAVLAEIAASAPSIKAPDAEPPSGGMAAKFQDPFQASAPVMPQQAASQPTAQASVDAPDASAAEAGGQPPQAAAPAPSQPSPAKTVAHPEPQPKVAAAVPAAAGANASKPAAPVPGTAAVYPAPTQAASIHAEDQKTHGEDQKIAQKDAEKAEAARLQSEIAAALGKDDVLPKIEVRPSSRGIVISLTDGFKYAMFAIGSAEPQKKTVQIMEKLAHIIKKEKGDIIISGHTDGRSYKSGSYDNWRLSAARAQMALYMLVRGGIDEKRVERIEGLADHELKVPNDPMAAQNRRIEILLRENKS
jgi:chemotaxis protein MotB